MPCCAVARSAPAVRSAILSPPEPAALPSGPSSDPLSSMSCALKLLTLQTLRLERCCCSSRAAHTCSANSRPPIVQQPPQQQQQRARRRSTAPRALATGPAASAMDPEVEMTVEKIHSSRARIVLYMAGGGSQAVSWLLSVPGASRTVLDVRVPYSRTSMAEVLGAPPANYASPETALALARAAYRQAAKLSPFGADIVGVGCAAALATDREKAGEHKAFVATYSGTQERSFSLLLRKGARSRLAEDSAVSLLLVRAIAESMGVGAQALELGLSRGGGEGGEGSGGGDSLAVESRSVGSEAALRDLLNGRVDTVEFSGGNLYVDAPRPARLYLPGSFNPLHDGHRELLQAACRLRPDLEGAFELSIGNADKGLLPLEEITRRVAQFTAAGLPLVVTQAPLFTQKADLFHDSVFVVGQDTAARLVRPDYYGNNDQAMLLQFAKLRHQGCSFLVAGRWCDAADRFLTLADVEVPEMLQRGGLFAEIPASEFRADVSSTVLRAGGGGGALM